MQIDGYEIIAEISKNQNTHLYKCQQDGQLYAMKVLFLDQISRKTFDRFKREMTILSQARHPSIVEPHKCGLTKVHLIKNFLAKESDSQLPSDAKMEKRGMCLACCYYTMEFVTGPSLGELLVGGHTFSESDVLHIALKIVEVLDFFQAQNIVHRDLKPSNIMLSRDYKVKVADLGLAKALETEGVDITMGHSFLGTPFYIAPETMLGENKELDCSIDVYSLGATLYHLLAGFPPYLDLLFQQGAREDNFRDYLSNFEKYQNNFVNYISVALGKKPCTPLRKAKPNISLATAKLIEKMMASKPDQRPAPKALEDSIKKALRGGGIKESFPSAALENSAGACKSGGLATLTHLPLIREAFFSWCLFEISWTMPVNARICKKFAAIAANDVLKLLLPLKKWNFLPDLCRFVTSDGEKIFHLLASYCKWRQGMEKGAQGLPELISLYRKLASPENKAYLQKLCVVGIGALPPDTSLDSQELTQFLHFYSKVMNKDNKIDVIKLAVFASKLFVRNDAWNMQNFANFLQFFPLVLSPENAAQLLIATSKLSFDKSRLESAEFATFLSLYQETAKDSEREARILRFIAGIEEQEESFDLQQLKEFFVVASRYSLSLKEDEVEVLLKIVEKLIEDGKITNGILFPSEYLEEYSKDFLGFLAQREDLRVALQFGDVNYLHSALKHGTQQKKRRFFHLRELDKLLAKGAIKPAIFKKVVVESCGIAAQKNSKKQ